MSVAFTDGLDFSFVPPWFAISRQRRSSQEELANWKGWLIISWIFIIQLLLKSGSSRTFSLRMLCEPCFSTESCTDSSPRSSVLPHTQHKYLQIQTHSELINSVCPPTSPISLIHSDTHAQKVFFAICMRQYERITQARKGKAELDYSGSLWHEKPTDKFLSPTTVVRIGLSNNPSYTHAYAYSQAWNRTRFAW